MWYIFQHAESVTLFCQGVSLHCYAVFFYLTGELAGSHIPSSHGRSERSCVTEGHSLNNVERWVHVRRCHSSLHSRAPRVLYCLHTAAPNANRAPITSSRVQENKDIRKPALICFFKQKPVRGIYLLHPCKEKRS